MTNVDDCGAFASAVEAYYRAGWPAIFPVPVAAKSPPPAGFTGAAGVDTTPEQLAAWATNGHGGHSIALRMPEGVIGLDVDDYVKGETVKTGAGTLAAHEAMWGPLPPTWVSTARGNDAGPGPSAIRFFRVPSGRYATVLGPSIEVVQRHHRYAVVAPSVNPEVAAPCRWYRPDGSPADPGEVPRPAELAELPAAWVGGLRAGATAAGPAPADAVSGQRLLAALQLDERAPCAEVVDATAQTDPALAGAGRGARHDVMTARTRRLVALGAEGHPGLGATLRRLREQWLELTAGEDREDEFDRMLLTAARKSVTEVGSAPLPADPCLRVGGVTVPGPAPVDDRADSSALPLVDVGTPVVDYSWRHVVGTAPFDPPAELDLTLAAAVLARTGPMLRYASDTRNGWLQRGPVQWELHGDLTRRAVAEVASLMPKGDPTPPGKGEPPTPEQRQAKRRARLHTNASAGAVAASMKALVVGGWHPNAIDLADLDNDPEVLWAGGMAYDLRASAGGPALAALDPGTPHLCSAAVAPEIRPTPYWDVFVAEVWPDAEVRAWSLRVLSVALTGHPDAALPILLGPGGSGKTSTVELVMSVLGSYAHAANVKLLSGESSHDSIVFALKGRRLSFIDEGPREGRWAQERLKQLTGGAALTGNAMNQNPITFRPTHTLVLTSNSEPLLTDEAVRRRVRLIPCQANEGPVRAARVAISPQVWRDEAPGVLAALMREAAAWLADPDSALTAAAPASIRGRAEEIAAEQDVVVRWLEEACEEWPAGTPSGHLHEQFVCWCRSSAIRRIPDAKEWGAALDQAGFPVHRTKHVRLRALRVRPRDPWGAGSPPSGPPGDGWTPSGVGSGTDPSTSPVTQQNPSSNPVFASSVTGVTGQPPVGGEEPTDTSRWRKGDESFGAGGDFARGVTRGGMNAPRPAEMGVTAPVTRPAEPSPAPRTVSRTEAARRAHEDKITTAQARRRLSEDKRRAAVAEAGGAVHALPAVVDRDGPVLSHSLDQVRAIITTAVARSGALTVDVETTGYPVGHVCYALRSVQLGDATTVVVLDPVAHAELIREQLAAAPRLHAHSAPADLVPLAHAGLVDPEDAWARMYDTVLPAKLADPTSTGSDPGLKQLAGTMLGGHATAPPADEARAGLFTAGRWLSNVKPATPPERSGWAQVPTGCEVMLRYAASDVLDTAALAQVFASTVEQAPLVIGRERLAQRMTARITHRGVRLDPERIAALTLRHTAARDEVAARVRAFGVDNPGSAPQVAATAASLGADLPRTRTGRLSVAAGVLEPLRTAPGDLAEFVCGVLDYRHHQTVLGLFLTPYAELCERGDGRARPTVYALGTDTGRMSCTRPNLQQVPREGGVRACLTADPGHVLISADFASIELRVAAALSGDPNLRDMIDNGDDLHWRIAQQIWGPQATKAQRYIAKRDVFGRIYGGGVRTLAAQTGQSEATTQAVIDTLDALTPTLTEWSRSIAASVQAGITRFPAYSGRTIHLPGQTPHAGPNYCVQGSARELLVDALTRWADTRWGRVTLWPVHDEVVAMVPAEDGEAATAELARCMTSELNSIKIVAEPTAPSFAWADAT